MGDLEQALLSRFQNPRSHQVDLLMFTGDLRRKWAEQIEYSGHELGLHVRAGHDPQAIATVCCRHKELGGENGLKHVSRRVTPLRIQFVSQRISSVTRAGGRCRFFSSWRIRWFVSVRVAPLLLWDLRSPIEFAGGPEGCVRARNRPGCPLFPGIVECS
jgi:hypothetical protein